MASYIPRKTAPPPLFEDEKEKGREHERHGRGSGTGPETAHFHFQREMAETNLIQSVRGTTPEKSALAPSVRTIVASRVGMDRKDCETAGVAGVGEEAT